MIAPNEFYCHSQDESGICVADGPEQACVAEADQEDKKSVFLLTRNANGFEPVSSSPSASPKTGTSPRPAVDVSAYTQDSEPVPFSSTPDLGSRSTSSSPSFDYDSQLVVTPPEEKFIRALDKKLQDLLEERRRGCISSSVTPFHPCLQDEGSQTTTSEISAEGYASVPSSVGLTNSRLSLKRKRTEPPTCDTTVDAPESTVDGGGDTEVEDAQPSPPVCKKLKETSFNYTVTEAASVRRARSLSVSSSHESLIPTEKASPSPSPPSTPVYKAPAVPIIAPPDFSSIPRPSLSPDDASEARLKALLKRELILRRREGFEGGIDDIFDRSTSKEQVDELLGIDEESRREVISWMLRITPSKKLDVGELRHQLRTCPETRFHAIQLFTRYFMRVGDAMPISTGRETPLMKLCRKRITWDVAMSCLALAVKFNRDFLNPLSPVYSREFLVLAPHPMSHDDFEISQKDVLQALNYEIRDITPGPFMQEIWGSLPSLRRLLSFPDGWALTQLNSWQILNAAATASEMIQFPMSLLTAAAIIEGAVVALMDKFEEEGGENDPEVSARAVAEAEIADTILDIKELMEIPSVDMKRCRRWLHKIIRATY